MVIVGVVTIAAIFLFDGFAPMPGQTDDQKAAVASVTPQVQTPLEYYRANPVETRRAYRAAVRACTRNSRSRNMPIRFERMQADYFMVAVRLAVRFDAKTISHPKVVEFTDREQRKVLLKAFLDGRPSESLSSIERERLKRAFEVLHKMGRFAQSCIDQNVIATMSQQTD